MNLYVHFPFCRSKCAYCALHSRAGAAEQERLAYSERIAGEILGLLGRAPRDALSSVYFGGGTPALCDLRPIFAVLAPHILTGPGECTEFTVELNPLDVSPALLDMLHGGGVNRISMGVQSFDDPTLRAMGRLHTAEQALAAWSMIRAAGFANAGIDLICGWPDGCGVRSEPSDSWLRTIGVAASVKPDHCSVYTLILEPGTRLAHDVESGRARLPADDAALAELAAAERGLLGAGLERYEISSFARPGMECRHNLAVWRGEDYTGIGDGACSREGGAVSRTIFRLRLLKEGLSPVAAAADFPELGPRVAGWTSTLDRFAGEGLLTKGPGLDGTTYYRLTPRGAEVCDTILAELV